MIAGIDYFSDYEVATSILLLELLILFWPSYYCYVAIQLDILSKILMNCCVDYSWSNKML